MKRAILPLVAFCIAAAAAAAAEEKPALTEVKLMSGPGGGFGALYVLAQQAVQENLQLTEAQLTQVRERVREVYEKQQAFFREKDPEKRKQLGDEAVLLRVRYDHSTPPLLTPEQAQRFAQIMLHYRGHSAFWDPDIRNFLRITPEQFAKIQEIGREQYSAWSREITEEYRKTRNFKAYQRKQEEIRRRRDREQLAVLTPGQRAQWQEMLGDPFKGPIPSPILIAAAAQPETAPGPRSARPEEPPAREGPSEDTVDRLAETVQALAREIATLNREVRRLRKENERLRRQLEGRGMSAAPGRFRGRGEYVEDTQTGLLWQKDGDASGKLNYPDANRYAASLKLGGHTGWRLPTRDEIRTIFPAVEPPFTDTKYNPRPYGKGPGVWASYWTADLDPRGRDYAYVYHWYAAGGANNCLASQNYVYVRCVHDPIRKVP